MMKLTIGSEAVFFIALIMAYLFFWRSGNFEAKVLEHLRIQSTALFTCFLTGSSFTFLLAERSHKKENYGLMKFWLLLTILLAIIFLGGQGQEYFRLINKHITISQGEFGSSFFALTGFHGLHVLIGIILLSVVLGLSFAGHFKNRPTSVISTIGIYWHFVDIVWLIVFTVIYLLPYIL